MTLARTPAQEVADKLLGNTFKLIAPRRVEKGEWFEVETSPFSYMSCSAPRTGRILGLTFMGDGGVELVYEDLEP